MLQRWFGNRASQSLGITLVLLAVIAAVSFLTTRWQLAEARRVEHTYDVREMLTAMLTDLVDAESGGRGFLLTGHAAYLKPYEDARKALSAHLADLRRLTRDNPRQQRRLDTLEPVARAKVAFMERLVAVRGANGEAAARALANGKLTDDACLLLVRRNGGPAENGILVNDKGETKQ